MAALVEIESLDALERLVGREVAVSDWIDVTQQRIDRCAEATEDFQWIHVDPARARASPMGGTIAHGFLTLSLIAGFSQRTLRYPFAKYGINYGLNRVRFTSPVPAGSRLRAVMKLLECQDLPDNGMQLAWLVTVEREGAAKPACIAESLTRRYA